jgi:hypothetical protein
MHDRFGVSRAVRQLPDPPHIVHGHAPCDAQCLVESVTVCSVHHLQKPADSLNLVLRRPEAGLVPRGDQVPLEGVFLFVPRIMGRP